MMFHHAHHKFDDHLCKIRIPAEFSFAVTSPDRLSLQSTDKYPALSCA